MQSAQQVCTATLHCWLLASYESIGRIKKHWHTAHWPQLGSCQKTDSNPCLGQFLSNAFSQNLSEVSRCFCPNFSFSSKLFPFSRNLPKLYLSEEFFKSVFQKVLLELMNNFFKGTSWFSSLFSSFFHQGFASFFTISKKIKLWFMLNESDNCEAENAEKCKD